MSAQGRLGRCLWRRTWHGEIGGFGYPYNPLQIEQRCIGIIQYRNRFLHGIEDHMGIVLQAGDERQARCWCGLFKHPQALCHWFIALDQSPCLGVHCRDVGLPRGDHRDGAQVAPALHAVGKPEL